VNSITEFNVPDEAVSFIVSNYLRKKSVEAVSLTVGIPSNTVEDILLLFFQWAEKNALVEGNKITIDLEKY
jgi:Zn finger protein HypA/HybF involved in hydrogenase expression